MGRYARKADYSEAHVLLHFLARFVEEGGPCRIKGVELCRDGGMLFRLLGKKSSMVVFWTEKPTGRGTEIVFSGGTVRAESRNRATDKYELSRTARHLARRLERLLAGNPPHLLLWRNRNPQQVVWGKRMFTNLCPGLLEKGKTRYFDYVLSDLDEMEGHVNLTFESRHAKVFLRLLAGAGAPPKKALFSWSSLALLLLADERSASQRRQPEHRVEDFVCYLLSRNLPPRFTLLFDGGDPPTACQGAERVDFLRLRRLDDSNFFKMLLASDPGVAIVSSCPRECFNLFSFVSAAAESWITEAPWQTQPSARILDNCFHACLNPRATVMGDENSVRCLDALAGSTRPPRQIIFFDSCLHRLIGEDVPAWVQAYRKKHSVPLVYYDIRTTQQPYLKQLRDFWTNLFLATAKRRRPEANRVVFLGMPRLNDPELDTAFQRLGLHHGGAIMPHLSLATIQDMRSSSLLVGNLWDYIRLMFSDMLKLLDRPVIWLSLPYGMAGTSRWLDSVQQALRGEAACLDDIPQLSRIEEEFARQRKHLEGNSVAICGRLEYIRRQLSARMRFGVPLLEFFRELGLGVDVVLLTPAESEEARTDLVAEWLKLDLAGTDSVCFYRRPEQLPHLLRAGRFSLVYTETFRDRRVTSAGKVPLMLRHLEMGYRGAVRTARTIRGLLQSNLYRRHGKYFIPAETTGRRRDERKGALA